MRRGSDQVAIVISDESAGSNRQKKKETDRRERKERKRERERERESNNKGRIRREGEWNKILEPALLTILLSQVLHGS